MNLSIKSIMATLIGGALVSTAALAHHSYAIFDMANTVPLTMIVKKFDWANPHAWIYGMVKGSDGAEAEWALELRSPNELTRQGLRSIDIKPGDSITADVSVARDGTKVATVIRATLANGKKFGRTKGEAEGTGTGGQAPG